MLKSGKELLEYVMHSTEVRVEKKESKIVISAILAGVFIGLGAVGNIVTSSDLYPFSSGFAKFIGASVFPVGLIAIVLLGLELFTSNCMMVVSYITKKISLRKMIKTLIIVWFFNLIGGILLSLITYKTHTLNEAGIKLLYNMAEHKIGASPLDLILKGIMCNILVCGGSLLGYISKDGISKIFGIWFPIMLFIVLGYSHVVANMLYLPLAHLYFPHEITIVSILYNFVFVTIGNFIGGGFAIAIPFWFLNKD